MRVLILGGSRFLGRFLAQAALDRGHELVLFNRGQTNPDLFPENNPVLRPPVKGRVGLWAKTDSTSYFKDYVVTPK